MDVLVVVSSSYRFLIFLIGYLFDTCLYLTITILDLIDYTTSINLPLVGSRFRGNSIAVENLYTCIYERWHTYSRTQGM